MSRTKGRSITTNVTLTPPSKSSTFICTSSKNPRPKIARTSSESCEGLKKVPGFVWTRPKMTASWTRRLPSTVMSLTRIGRGCCWASAAVAAARRVAHAQRTEKRTRPLALTGPSGSRDQSLMLCKLEGGVHGLSLTEYEVAPVDIHLDARALRDLAAHDGFCQRVLDVLLDRTPELTGAISRVVALFHQRLLSGLGEHERDTLLGQ